MTVGTNAGANLFFTNFNASTSTAISASGAVTVNGTCVVTLADTANLSQGNTYTLISYSSYSGSGRFVLSPLPGGLVGGLINDPAYGGLLLSLPASTSPTNLTVATTFANGVTTLNISWPASYQGWALESNNVSLADAGAWSVVPGSEYTTSESINVDPTQTNVFFRLAP